MPPNPNAIPGPGPLTRNLEFERKNKNLQKLPNYAKIHKRPISHPPISSPYTGSQIPKTVYISTKTPFMSAVKRIQKLLREAEKRAIAVSSSSSGRMSSKNNTKITSASSGNREEKDHEKLFQIAKDTDQELKRGKEEVFVKATGRAMEKALAVGSWFGGDGDGDGNNEGEHDRSESGSGSGSGARKEMQESEYNVRVSTGSVLAVDDIVEDEIRKKREVEIQQQQQQQDDGDDIPMDHQATTATSSNQSSKKSKKRKRPTISADTELPETRTRWVNMVQVAISLK